jgi:acyl-CoA reductase-like NAD-dependent aldehyde dehydrogenase
MWMWPIAISSWKHLHPQAERNPADDVAVIALEKFGLPLARQANIVHGGRECGCHSRTREVISFVGSTPVARKSTARALLNGKRAQAAWGEEFHHPGCRMPTWTGGS